MSMHTAVPDGRCSMYQRCILRLLQMLLEEKAKCSIRKRQEQVIVRVEGIAVTGKTVHEKLQLVVGRP